MITLFISFNPYLHHNACVYFYVWLICFRSLSWCCYFSNILCSDSRWFEPFEKEPDTSRSALYLQTTDQTQKCVLLQCLVCKCPNLTFCPWESSTSLKFSCGGWIIYHRVAHFTQTKHDKSIAFLSLFTWDIFRYDLYFYYFFYFSANRPKPDLQV